MDKTLSLIIGVVALVLAFPIGRLLAHLTKEELKDGQVWFRILTFVGLLGGLLGLILQIDWMLFFSFFIAIISSQSLINKKRKINKKNKGILI